MTDQANDAISERLRRLRLDANLSQRELAIRAGVDQGTVSRIERGERVDIRAETIRALAGALGCSTDDIVPAQSARLTDDPLQAFLGTALGRQATGAQIFELRQEAGKSGMKTGEDYAKAYRSLFGKTPDPIKTDIPANLSSFRGGRKK